jgi:hypothetical protein
MAGFDNWGSYDYTTDGGAFVDETYVILSIANGDVFQITGVRDDDTNSYNGKPKPRYLVDFIDKTGEEKTRGFSKGIPERDQRLKHLQETIAATGEPIAARFVKVNKAYDVAGA